jgi:hypothetical protein
MRPSKRALERALGPDSDSGSSDWEYSSVDSLHEGQDKSTSPGEVCGHDQDEESGKEEESGNKDSSDEDSDQDLVDEEVSGAWVAPSQSITLSPDSCTSSLGYDESPF